MGTALGIASLVFLVIAAAMVATHCALQPWPPTLRFIPLALITGFFVMIFYVHPPVLTAVANREAYPLLEGLRQILVMSGLLLGVTFILFKHRGHK